MSQINNTKQSESLKVTIDKDQITHVNGKPFFPIFARHLPQGGTPADLREAGFNSMRWMAFGVDGGVVSPTPFPEDLGDILFCPYVYTNGDLSEDTENRTKELKKLVMKVRDHPKLLCYEQRNEPAYTPRDYATAQASPAGMLAGSDLIRSLDPDHPICLGHMCCNLVSTLRKFNPAADIITANPYILVPPGTRVMVGYRQDGKLADCPDQTMSAVGKYTSKMLRVAQGKKAVWMQLQAMAVENWYDDAHNPESQGQGLYPHNQHYPNVWQMRFMAFNAIIRGATGIIWTLWRLPVNSNPWNNVCKVVGELRQLHDVLASPPWDAELKVEYTELGFGDWDGVETLVKIHKSKPWILAANTQFDPMIATFSQLPQGLPDKLYVFGEDRKISVKNGTFTDRFQPYQVHVYSTEKCK